MSTFRRRQMMAAVNGVLLPYDAKIEYLESSGTQYITLPFVQKTVDFELTIKMQWVGSTLSQFESFFGILKTAGSVPRFTVNKYNGKWMFGINNTVTSTSSVDSDEHIIRVLCESSGNTETMYLDGTHLMSNSINNPAYFANNLLYSMLFARNKDGVANNLSYIRVMSMNYKEFADEQHSSIAYECDLIPVRVGQVGYMYDKVNGQLFGNDGTGNFTLGQDSDA